MKNIVCISLLLVTYCANSTTLSAGLIISRTEKRQQSECTSNVTQKRQPLFIKAETYEQNFINARVQCISAGDCDTNQAFEKARYEVLHSIYQLVDHLKELKNNTHDPDNKGEKNEAKHIRQRLIELQF
jgi:hypothetical protein